MAIKYYPNRIQKKFVPAIDRELAKRDPLSVNGSHDLAGAMDVRVSANDDWQLDSVSLVFSGAVARDYSVVVQNGRKVVTDLNDYLWIDIDAVGKQRIILDEAFYTGTELANELKSKLDANSAFSAAGITFTVTYDASTGLFTITPSSGNIRYWETNPQQTLRTTDSIAGHLFGFNANTSYGASITSDTALLGLNTHAPIISETASTVVKHYHDDIHTLSIDQAIRLLSPGGVALTVTYTIVYETLV